MKQSMDNMSVLNYLKQLRKECMFNSVDELKKQMKNDVENARYFFKQTTNDKTSSLDAAKRNPG